MLADRVRRLLRGAPTAGGGGSALLVPVPEVEGLLGDLHRGSSGTDGLPPHVTVLFPFLEPASLEAPVLDRLASAFGRRRAFSFSLTGVDTFPGVVWLVPEPGRAFLELTEAVVELWPERVPYGDATLEVVPHLTVGRGRLRRRWRRTIEAALPIEARASEVLLMTEDADGTWTTSARFPLGAG